MVTSGFGSFLRNSRWPLAVVTLILVEPPFERQLTGSAIVHHQADDAVVRSVLDAVNRRLPYLAPDRDDS